MTSFNQCSTVYACCFIQGKSLSHLTFLPKRMNYVAFYRQRHSQICNKPRSSAVLTSGSALGGLNETFYFFTMLESREHFWDVKGTMKGVL